MAQTPLTQTTAAQRRKRNALGAQPWQPIPSGNETPPARAERSRNVHCANLDRPDGLKPLQVFAFVAAVKRPGKPALAVSVSTFAKSRPAAHAAILKTCRFFYGSALKGIRG